MLSLHPFQIDAIKKMLYFLDINPEKAVYNACEQGLGKTIQTIELINQKNYQKILIVCPSVMKFTWEQELLTWLNKPKCQRVMVIEKGSDVSHINSNNNFKFIDIVIASYNIVTTHLDSFLAFAPDLLVLDEAHNLKSLKAKRTKAVLKHLWPVCKERIALSGTPFTRNVIDGFTIFSKCSPLDFPSFWHFAHAYTNVIKTQWGTEFKGVRNPEKLRDIIRAKFYLRYTKDEVLKDLPSKTYKRITLPASLAAKLPKSDEALAKIEEQELIKCIKEDRAPAIPKTLQGLRRLQGIAKIDSVTEYVKELLEQDVPVVLFGYHKDVIAGYRESLKKYNPVFITGDTPDKERQEAIIKFQARQTKLFIGNIVAAGVGITLTASCDVVLGELDWSPSNIAQAVDRTHRIGQKNSVTIHYFIVDKSVDERIADALVRKVKEFKSVVDS